MPYLHLKKNNKVKTDFNCNTIEFLLSTIVLWCYFSRWQMWAESVAFIRLILLKSSFMYPAMACSQQNIPRDFKYTVSTLCFDTVPTASYVKYFKITFIMKIKINIETLFLNLLPQQSNTGTDQWSVRQFLSTDVVQVLDEWRTQSLVLGRQRTNRDWLQS